MRKMAWGAPSSSIGESRKRLQAIEADINRSQQEWQDKDAREKALKRSVAAVEKEIEHLVARIDDEEQKVANLHQEIQSREKDKMSLAAELDTLNGLLRERLKALYKEDETGFLEIFFSSDGPDAALENIMYMSRIAHHDQELIARCLTTRRRVDDGVRALVELEKRQRGVLQELKQSRESLEEACTLKNRLLAKVGEDKKQVENRIAGLKEQARALDVLLKRLEQVERIRVEKLRKQQQEEQARLEARRREERRREAVRKAARGSRPERSRGSSDIASARGDFSRQRGQLPWPVRGPVKVGYGPARHPDLNTLYDSQGIEIGAAVGSPISAVWDGIVVFASPFYGYGNLLIIQHGDGFHTLYAQAARLLRRVGEPVRRGDVIARSGYNGRTSVYFAIRYRGGPVNPLKWLSRR
ncbi:MAG: peptidoglycan DD-metalloendopeptidase family protein [Deltaproteobacteria bacterium]|nr:peptidoglycan DD-metalloendopeptidase family protein [Deltaproteobacteria bacterium]